MILLAKAEKEFQCPVTRLFNYTIDMENYIDWFPGVTNIVSGNNKLSGQVGKHYIETLDLPTGEVELVIQVKASRTNQYFVTEGDIQPLMPMMTMRFQEKRTTSCIYSLIYHSRNTEWNQNDQSLKDIRQNLSERIIIAMENLEHIVNRNF